MSWWTEKLSSPAGPSPIQRSDTYVKIEQAVQKQGSYQAAQVLCPGCHGGNYGGGGVGRPRCFDCGYPIVQSGTTTNAATPVMGQSAARQVDGVSNYSPQTIVARM